MRTLPPHTVCISDLRIQLLLVVCVGMVHIIFSGSSNGNYAYSSLNFQVNLYQVNV